MLSVDDAVATLVAEGRRYSSDRGTHTIPLSRALGHILAEDVASPVDVPPGDNSAMDGYAFAYGQAEKHGFRLPVSQRIPAGSAPESLRKNTAARIFTGAEIPPGADTVAMQEDCRIEDGIVHIDGGAIKAGANIRPRGQDVRRGETILARGTGLRPQELGLLASVGRGDVSVYRPLRVAVFSTGDELVEPGAPLRPGQLYNSNRATLAGLLGQWNLELVDLGICPDSPAAVRETLIKAADSADLVVSSGGVSVGEEDHVKAAVEAEGELTLWKIAIKPGKPLAFGVVGGKPFFGLPGNPASVFVTALILLRPFLKAMAGQRSTVLRVSRERSLFARKPIDRREYMRARRTERGVEVFPNQSSGMLSSACWGDGLVVRYPDVAIEEGDTVDFIPYSELLL